MKTLSKILIGTGLILGFCFYCKANSFKNENKIKEIAGSLGYVALGSITIGGAVVGAKRYEEKNKSYKIKNDN